MRNVQKLSSYIDIPSSKFLDLISVIIFIEGTKQNLS
jgi:hypothetical protein